MLILDEMLFSRGPHCRRLFRTSLIAMVAAYRLVGPLSCVHGCSMRRPAHTRRRGDRIRKSAAMRMSPFGTKRTHRDSPLFVRFSNRPSGSSAFRLSTTPVSMSLAGSRFSSDSAPRPFHHGDSKTRWNNLLGGLAVSMMAGPSGQTISPHPSSREGHHSTAGWSSISSYRI
jgi:hypothetical protein